MSPTRTSESLREGIRAARSTRRRLVVAIVRAKMAAKRDRRDSDGPDHHYAYGYYDALGDVLATMRGEPQKHQPEYWGRK